MPPQRSSRKGNSAVLLPLLLAVLAGLFIAGPWSSRQRVLPDSLRGGGSSGLSFPQRVGGETLNHEPELTELQDAYAEIGTEVEVASWGHEFDGPRYVAVLATDLQIHSREVVTTFNDSLQTTVMAQAGEMAGDGALYMCYRAGGRVEGLLEADTAWCAWQTPDDVGILMDASSARYPLRLLKTLRSELGL
jgi:hypothetical protein